MRELVCGASLNFDIRGKGASTIIFIHGLGCDASDWNAQMDHLQDRYRVIGIDLPGHGGSDVVPEPSLPGFAAAVNEVRKRHASGGSLLVGHSMGCRIALEAFRQGREGVAGMTFIDAGYPAAGGSLASFQELPSRGEADPVKAKLRAQFAYMFENEGDFKQRAIGRIDAMSSNFIKRLLPTITAWDTEHLPSVLLELSVPVLLLQSSRTDASGLRRPISNKSDSAWATLFETHAPHVDVKLVRDTLHFPHVERAKCVNEEIARFARVSLR